MGNQNQAGSKESPRFCSSYITHPRMSRAQVCISKDQVPTYVQICSPVGNKDIFLSWKKNVESYRDRNTYSDSLYLPTSLEFEQQNFCGHTGTIKAKYDFMPFILKDELINRQKINQEFQEKELWYILYIIVCAGQGLHSRNELIGDVRPDNIFISDEGEIRLSTLHSFLDEDTGYQKFLMFREKAYLSPEQIEELQNGIQESKVDLVKSQCFSIGMTLLSISLLTDNSILYLNKQLQFDYPQFQSKMDQLVSCPHHPLMKNIIQCLCEIDEQNRLSCKEVVEALKPYQEQIVNLEPFEVNPNQLPLSIQKGMQGPGSARGAHNMQGRYAQVIHHTDRYGSSSVKDRSNSPEYKTNPTIYPPQQTVLFPNHFNGQGGQLFHQKNVMGQHINIPANPPQISSNRPHSAINYAPSFAPKVSDSAYLFNNTNQVPSGFNVNHAQPIYHNSPTHHNQPVYNPQPKLAHFAKQVNNSINVGNQIKRVQERPVLAAYGREAFSYKPAFEPEMHSFSNDNEKARRKDGMFDSYDQILKQADKQILKSRNMFPE